MTSVQQHTALTAVKVKRKEEACCINHLFSIPVLLFFIQLLDEHKYNIWFACHQLLFGSLILLDIPLSASHLCLSAL